MITSNKSVASKIDLQKIQLQILELFALYANKEIFFNQLLLLIAGLTNAQGAFYLKKQPQVEIEQFLLSITDKEQRDIVLQTAKEIGQIVFAEQCIKINQLENHNLFLIVVPVLQQQSPIEALGVLLEVNDKEQLAPFLLIVQLVSSYLPLIAFTQGAQESAKIAQRASAFVELLTSAMAQKDLHLAAQTMLDDMKKYLGCHRVALGITKRWHCRILTISGMEKFDHRSEVAKTWEAAMAEAIRERCSVFFPLPEDENKYTVQVDVAHKKLHKLLETRGIITVPLYDQQDKEVGAWSFVWLGETAPNKEDRYFIEAATSKVSILLRLLQSTRPNVFLRIFNKSLDLAKQGQTWILIFFLVALIVVMQLPWKHYVKASCELVPVERHVVAAPFDGVLEQTYSKPGDLVQPQQLLAVLDGREMRLELSSAQEALASALKKKDFLFAQEQIADYQITALEVKKIEEEIKLLKYQLSNLNIKASHFGIILQGDLKEAIGIPIKVGQVLFEIAPLKKLLLEIAIEESEIRYIKKSMKVELQISSYPGKTWHTKIISIAPVSEIKEEANVFICEAKLDNDKNALLAGMKGEVRIYIDEKPLWWIWFHKPIAWVRSKLWW